VLARCEQAFDDLAVEVVGDHDAHGVDVGRIGDRVPVVLGALVAVALGGVVGHCFVHVGYGYQAHAGPVGTEQRCRGTVSGRMGPSRHAAADDGHTD
jgi:hypothetical protein